jgi:hypothetical protein
METPLDSGKPATTDYYTLAASLYEHSGMSSFEVINALKEKGLDEATATNIAQSVEDDFNQAVRDRAKKDMIYGALWCVGGTVATLANIGFIFWGAILFGGIQFVRGAMKINS